MELYLWRKKAASSSEVISSGKSLLFSLREFAVAVFLVLCFDILIVNTHLKAMLVFSVFLAVSVTNA